MHKPGDSSDVLRVNAPGKLGTILYSKPETISSRKSHARMNKVPNKQS